MVVATRRGAAAASASARAAGAPPPAGAGAPKLPSLGDFEGLLAFYLAFHSDGVNQVRSCVAARARRARRRPRCAGSSGSASLEGIARALRRLARPCFARGARWGRSVGARVPPAARERASRGIGIYRFQASHLPASWQGSALQRRRGAAGADPKPSRARAAPGDPLRVHPAHRVVVAGGRRVRAGPCRALRAGRPAAVDARRLLGLLHVAEPAAWRRMGVHAGRGHLHGRQEVCQGSSAAFGGACVAGWPQAGHRLAGSAMAKRTRSAQVSTSQQRLGPISGLRLRFRTIGLFWLCD